MPQATDTDDARTPTTDDRTPRPRWPLPVALVGAALVALGLWLTQPWLLLVDTVADETLPISITETANAETVEGQTAGGADVAVSAAPTPPGPVVLLEGAFVSRDHSTTGVVAVVQLADGSRVLTIQDLDTDNGPDLFVYLDDDGADAPEGEFDDGRSLGRLRANQGDLVHDIPADVDLTTIASVGIWCDRFSSLFGAADLVPPA